jgi:PIN like domain
MRSKFFGYYKPTKEELAMIWNECIFVFDTSTLLNIYRYTPETREDFFKILERLQDRIWIPYQVGLEYHDQRENVISQQQTIYSDLDTINAIFQEKILNKYQKGHSFANIEQIKKVLNTAIDQSKKILREAESKHPNLLEEDIYLERITRLFEGRVGDHYPKNKLKKIYEEGQQRFNEKIPPGYEDERNKTYPFGDLVLWFQLIDYAQLQKKPIIFTIDDSKEDWWRKDKDKKEKILGPRTELVEEIHAKAEVPFYMYLADQFIKRAQHFLKVDIHPGTIKEVKETREQQEQDTTSIEDKWLRIIQQIEEIRSQRHNIIMEKQYMQQLLAQQQAWIENIQRPEKTEVDQQSLTSKDLFPEDQLFTIDARQRLIFLENMENSVLEEEQRLNEEYGHLRVQRAKEIAKGALREYKKSAK